MVQELHDWRVQKGKTTYICWINQEEWRSKSMAIRIEEVFLSTQLLKKYESKSGHL
jgi:hypothetical protein